LLPGAATPHAAAALAAAALDVRFVPVRRSRVRAASRIIGAALRGSPYVLYRKHDWSELRAAVEDELRRTPPDAVYLDHLDSFVYGPAVGSAPVVGDLHNVYSLLVRRTAEEQANPLLGLYLRREARLLDRAERSAARRADLLMTVSSQEQQHFASLGAKRVEVIPNGVDCQRYEQLPAAARTGPPLVLYIGTMSWPANAAAAAFLATTVMPAVRAHVPGARLRIVGRDPLPEVRELGRDPCVEVTGTVPDVIPHLADAHVLAVPLESGGGTRLKILEAFAAGVPVVSTPVGAEGIDAEPGRHLLVTARATVADALAALLRDPARAASIAAAARTLARARYDWRAIGARAADAISEVMAAAASRRGPK
jgi:glycosyltransferase involved in cell wall biosynthesis